MNWINPRGEIVGVYTDANAVQHGYLLTHGKFITAATPVKFVSQQATWVYDH